MPFEEPSLIAGTCAIHAAAIILMPSFDNAGEMFTLHETRFLHVMKLMFDVCLLYHAAQHAAHIHDAANDWMCDSDKCSDNANPHVSWGTVLHTKR